MMTNSKSLPENKSWIKEFFKYLGHSIFSFFKRNMYIFIGLIAICIIITLLTDKFFTVSNGMNILRQVSTNALLAFGMTLVMISGGIDLSIGSIVAVSGTFAIGLSVSGLPVIISIFVGIIAGTALGLINGLVIAKTHMPAFIVTLAMMNIARGIAYIYTGGLPINFNDPLYSFIGNGYIGGFFPVPVFIMLVLMIFNGLLLSKSRFGRYIYAIGGNRNAAQFSGIKIFKAEVVAYVISGLLASVTGIMLSARMYSALPTVGQGFEMDAIAAVVLGGTSFTGGSGSIGGTMIGVLIIGVLNNGMNLLQIPFYYQLLLKGVVIVFAVYLDTMKKRKAGV